MSDVQPPPPADPATDEDVESAYMLALGRAPEDHSIVQGNRGRSLAELTISLFASLEFDIVVAGRLAIRRRPRGELHRASPSPALIRWAAARLPLSPAGREKVGGAADWVGLYQRLLHDGVFGRLVGPHLPRPFSSLVQALDSLVENPASGFYEGAVEEGPAGEVRGWALDIRRPEGGLPVQLYVEGRFSAAGVADAFRRDIQDQFGGSGAYGFRLSLPEALHARDHSVEIEVRSGLDGVVVAEGQLPPSVDANGAGADLARELAKVRESLERLERAIAPVRVGSLTPFDRYQEYAAFYYGRANALEPADLEEAFPLSVILDGYGAPPQALGEAIDGLATQSFRNWSFVLVCDPSLDPALATDLITRLTWRSGAPGEVVVGGDRQPARLTAALRRSTRDHVVVLDPEVVLDPDGLAELARALLARPVSGALYGDDDRMGSDRSHQRIEPAFRPGYDEELLLQRPDLGGVILLSQRALTDAGGLQADAAEGVIEDAVLRIQRSGWPITHVARVLASRRGPLKGVPENWRSVVERRIAESEPGATVEVHSDALGSAVQGALRIRRDHLLDDRSALVVIPSRDRADLLGPCLESIQNSRPHNRVPIDIVVVDNGSQDTAALDVLSKANARGVDIRRCESPFNWALLSNLGVKEASADVLIFLNDDTLVISPDWCDALCEQALRPDVGAVGARLLYPDGTIQHAGVVLRERYGFAAHEGVGEPVQFGGYLGRYTFVREAAAVTGACLATRREVFEALGGFDSAALPVEGNDIDYCLRARAAGLKVIYTPYATLHHLESKSRGFSIEGEKLEVANRATELLWTRWGERFTPDPTFNGHFDRRHRPFAFLRPPARG